LHAYPPADNEDEFYVTGEAVFLSRQEDAPIRAAFLAERNWTEHPPPGWDAQDVSELLLTNVLHTKTQGRADFAPVHTTWRAP
jgi:hypothetical protein